MKKHASATPHSGPATAKTSQEKPPADRRPALGNEYTASLIGLMRSGSTGERSDVVETAEAGVQNVGEAPSYLKEIEAAFGHHDIGDVKVHRGREAEASSQALGAKGYAIGADVALSKDADKRTEIHELAHVVQGRGGVSLKNNLGEVGDQYEQHADRVADAVMSGESAEGILDEMTSLGGGSGGGQRSVQLDGEPTRVKGPEQLASEAAAREQEERRESAEAEDQVQEAMYFSLVEGMLLEMLNPEDVTVADVHTLQQNVCRKWDDSQVHWSSSKAYVIPEAVRTDTMLMKILVVAIKAERELIADNDPEWLIDWQRDYKEGEEAKTPNDRALHEINVYREMGGLSPIDIKHVNSLIGKSGGLQGRVVGNRDRLATFTDGGNLEAVVDGTTSVLEYFGADSVSLDAALVVDNLALAESLLAEAEYYSDIENWVGEQGLHELMRLMVDAEAYINVAGQHLTEVLASREDSAAGYEVGLSVVKDASFGVLETSLSVVVGPTVAGGVTAAIENIATQTGQSMADGKAFDFGNLAFDTVMGAINLDLLSKGIAGKLKKSFPGVTEEWLFDKMVGAGQILVTGALKDVLRAIKESPEQLSEAAFWDAVLSRLGERLAIYFTAILFDQYKAKPFEDVFGENLDLDAQMSWTTEGLGLGLDAGLDAWLGAEEKSEAERASRVKGVAGSYESSDGGRALIIVSGSTVRGSYPGGSFIGEFDGIKIDYSWTSSEGKAHGTGFFFVDSADQTAPMSLTGMWYEEIKAMTSSGTEPGPSREWTLRKRAAGA
jgi:hypothetical protein